MLSIVLFPLVLLGIAPQCCQPLWIAGLVLLGPFLQTALFTKRESKTTQFPFFTRFPDLHNIYQRFDVKLLLQIYFIALDKILVYARVEREPVEDKNLWSAHFTIWASRPRLCFNLKITKKLFRSGHKPEQIQALSDIWYAMDISVIITEWLNIFH